MMKPAIMGAAMGAMMVWMLHGALTGDGAMGAGALIAFIAAHVVIAGILGLAVWAGTRLSPRVRAVLDRLHRPSLRHVGVMLGSAAICAGSIHVLVHGGLS